MKMAVTSSIQIDAQKILDSRGLGVDQKAAKKMASEIKRLCDPYVPMQQGALKNTAQVVETTTGVAILYNQPYAHYQYYGEVMAGRAPKQYTGAALDYHGAPMRGKQWDKRMLADKGDEVARALANAVGGKAK